MRSPDFRSKADHAVRSDENDELLIVKKPGNTHRNNEIATRGPILSSITSDYRNVLCCVYHVAWEITPERTRVNFVSTIVNVDHNCISKARRLPRVP